MNMKNKHLATIVTLAFCIAWLSLTIAVIISPDRMSLSTSRADHPDVLTSEATPTSETGDITAWARAFAAQVEFGRDRLKNLIALKTANCLESLNGKKQRSEEVIHLTVGDFQRHLDEQLVTSHSDEIWNEFARVLGRVDPFLDWAFSYTTKAQAGFNFMRDAGNRLIECANWVKKDLVAVTPNHNAAMFRDEFERRVMSQSDLDDAMRAIGRRYEEALQNKLIECQKKLQRDLSEILNHEFTLAFAEIEVKTAFETALQELSQDYARSAGAQFMLGTLATYAAGELAKSYVLGSIMATQWYAIASAQAGSWLGLSASTLVGIGGGFSSGVAGVVGFLIVDYLVERWQRPKLRTQVVEMITAIRDGLIYGRGTSDGFRTSARRLNADVCKTLENLFLHKVLEKTIANRVAMCRLVLDLTGT